MVPKFYLVVEVRIKQFVCGTSALRPSCNVLKKANSLLLSWHSVQMAAMSGHIMLLTTQPAILTCRPGRNSEVSSSIFAPVAQSRSPVRHNIFSSQIKLYSSGNSRRGNLHFH